MVICLGEGPGGFRRMYEVIGVECAGYVSSGGPKEAQRVRRTAWPDVREWPHPRNVTVADLRNFQHAAPRALFGLVAASVAPSRLRDAKASACRPNPDHISADDVMALIERLSVEWTDVTWGWLIETNAGAAYCVAAWLPTKMRSAPTALDAANFSHAQRPFLAWKSWVLTSTETWGSASFDEPDRFGNLAVPRARYADGRGSPTKWLDPGCQWTEDVLPRLGRIIRHPNESQDWILNRVGTRKGRTDAGTLMRWSEAKRTTAATSKRSPNSTWCWIRTDDAD